MKHAILGAGNIGKALARKFAENKIQTGIANSRGPESLAPLRSELGESIIPQSVEQACEAEVIYLAVPFKQFKKLAMLRANWNGKILVDLTNAFDTSAEELGNRLSSEVIAEAFTGARLVKGFNHLPAAQLGTSEASSQQTQAVFLSSNDADASATIAATAGQLGFAAVQLGRLDQGGVPLHIVNGRPGGLIFQNLAKVNQ